MSLSFLITLGCTYLDKTKTMEAVVLLDVSGFISSQVPQAGFFCGGVSLVYSPVVDWKIYLHCVLPVFLFSVGVIVLLVEIMASGSALDVFQVNQQVLT